MDPGFEQIPISGRRLAYKYENNVIFREAHFIAYVVTGIIGEKSTLTIILQDRVWQLYSFRWTQLSSGIRTLRQSRQTLEVITEVIPEISYEDLNI